MKVIDQHGQLTKYGQMRCDRAIEKATDNPSLTEEGQFKVILDEFPKDSQGKDLEAAIDDYISSLLS
jgi:hypothetical protein